MKKLTLLLGAAALCGMAQAATFAWKNSDPIGQGYAGTVEDITSGTVYLIDGLAANGGIAAEDMWKDLYSGTRSFDALMTQYSINSATLAAEGMLSDPKNGSMTGVTAKFDATKPNGGAYANQDPTSVYQVIRVGGSLGTEDGYAYFFSEVLNPKVNGTGDTEYYFENNGSIITGITKSETLGTGWMAVNATAVPEPTSGLLMLVGLSLLGLRRKRRE